MTLVGRGAEAQYRQSDNRRNYTRRLWFVGEAYDGGGGDQERGRSERERERERGRRGGTTMPPRQKASAVVMSCKKGVEAHARI